MKLVIDTNRIIAALIRDSSCRRIILNDSFSFLSPDFTQIEIEKYKSLILKKSGLSETEYNIVIEILFENIEIIPKEDYKRYLSKASKEIDDKKDVPFLALALSQDCDGLWSDDKDFDRVTSVKVYKTANIIQLLEEKS